MNLSYDLPKHKARLIHYNHKQTLATSESLSKITLVTSTQSWIHCTVILSISLALGCKIISGTEKIASVWNSGTFARTAALKACKFLGKEKNHMKVIIRCCPPQKSPTETAVIRYVLRYVNRSVSSQLPQISAGNTVYWSKIVPLIPI